MIVNIGGNDVCAAARQPQSHITVCSTQITTSALLYVHKNQYLRYCMCTINGIHYFISTYERIHTSIHTHTHTHTHT